MHLSLLLHTSISITIIHLRRRCCCAVTFSHHRRECVYRYSFLPRQCGSPDGPSLFQKYKIQLLTFFCIPLPLPACPCLSFPCLSYLSFPVIVFPFLPFLSFLALPCQPLNNHRAANANTDTTTEPPPPPSTPLSQSIKFISRAASCSTTLGGHRTARYHCGGQL